MVDRVIWTDPPTESNLKSWTQISKQTDKNCVKIPESEQNNKEFQCQNLEIGQDSEGGLGAESAFLPFPGDRRLRSHVVRQ